MVERIHVLGLTEDERAAVADGLDWCYDQVDVSDASGLEYRETIVDVLEKLERTPRPNSRLQRYVEAGLSPAEALDYFMTEDVGADRRGWKLSRGVSQQAISENVNKAREKLDKVEQC